MFGPLFLANEITGADTPAVWKIDNGVYHDGGWIKSSLALSYEDLVRDDDSYYMTSKGAAGNGVSDRIHFSMAPIADPGVDAGFNLVVKHQGIVIDGADLRVYLYSDGVNIHPTGGTWNFTPAAGAQVETQAIAEAAIANITDWSSVEMRIWSVHDDETRVYYAHITTP